MPITVTLRIFSGRPNPRWALSQVQVKQLGLMLDRLARPLAPQVYRVGGLGYHGFEVRLSGEGRTSLSVPFAVYGGTVGPLVAGVDQIDTERAVERWLLESNTALDPRIKEVALKEFDMIYEDPHCNPEPSPLGDFEGRLPYKPTRWNSPQAVSSNNCYNYAANRRRLSGDTATPGAGGNQPVPVGDCPAFREAVLADENKNLAAVPKDATKGWPIALFTGHQLDNHFYRQDDSGYWSHKPGGFPVRNCDESGDLIVDPRKADTLDYKFCGFFLTGPFAKIK